MQRILHPVEVLLVLKRVAHCRQAGPEQLAHRPTMLAEMNQIHTEADLVCDCVSNQVPLGLSVSSSLHKQRFL